MMFKKAAPNSPPQIAAFREAVNTHVWQKQALDAFESHAFTGKPDTERWCTRCTLMLKPGWKNPTLPVPPMCGDPSVPFRPAWGGGAAYLAEVAKNQKQYELVAD